MSDHFLWLPGALRPSPQSGEEWGESARRGEGECRVPPLVYRAKLRHRPAPGRDGHRRPHGLPHLQGLRQDKQHGELNFSSDWSFSPASTSTNMKPLNIIAPCIFSSSWIGFQYSNIYSREGVLNNHGLIHPENSWEEGKFVLFFNSLRKNAIERDERSVLLITA